MIPLALLLMVAGGVLAVVGVQQRRQSMALETLLDEFEIVEDASLDDYTASLATPIHQRLLGPIAHNVAGSLSGLLPRNHIENVRHRLVLSGLRQRIGAEEFVTYQAIAAAGGLVLGILLASLIDTSGPQRLAVGVLVGGIVAALPSAWLSRSREERVEALERELPDVLDLLAISVEAGVGLEGAFAVVHERFESPLSREIGHTLKEMELGLSRVQALQNLKSRTEVPDLSGFILALVQADALGMPLGRILRTQADEMRRRRQARVREQAARLPVKLLFPLALFILPALFVVVLGPALLQIAATL